jgi:hypothetical protein
MTSRCRIRQAMESTGRQLQLLPSLIVTYTTGMPQLKIYISLTQAETCSQQQRH